MSSLTRRSIAPLLLIVGLPVSLAAQEYDNAGETPARAGRISSMLGAVSLQQAESNDWIQPSLNFTLTSGDRLATGSQSRAEVEVGSYVMRIADSTDVTIVALTDHFLQLSLADGTMRLSVFAVAPGDSIEVDTPQGASIIRSSGRYRFESPIGRRSSFSPSDDFDAWSAARDDRSSGADCSLYLSQEIPGCADLYDNGRWTQHPVYGAIWYPRVATGWAPYRFGRWVWVGPWGWTWVATEPWGYAPFHYGRWVMIGSAWAWAPGPIIRRPCYEPALVRFVGRPRYERGFPIGVTVWFPLAPREPFYPWYRSGPRAFPYVASSPPRWSSPYSANPNYRSPSVPQRPTRFAQPRPVEPRGVEPRGVEPRGVGPRGVGPRGVEPRVVEPRRVEPRVVDPRVIEPRVVEPRLVEPRMVEPRVVEPRGAEPRGIEPRVFEPRVAQPRSEAPSVRSGEAPSRPTRSTGPVGVPRRRP
jgi:hypothetical protein